MSLNFQLNSHSNESEFSTEESASMTLSSHRSSLSSGSDSCDWAYSTEESVSMTLSSADSTLTISSSESSVNIDSSLSSTLSPSSSMEILEPPSIEPPTVPASPIASISPHPITELDNLSTGPVFILIPTLDARLLPGCESLYSDLEPEVAHEKAHSTLLVCYPKFYNSSIEIGNAIKRYFIEHNLDYVCSHWETFGFEPHGRPPTPIPFNDLRDRDEYSIPPPVHISIANTNHIESSTCPLIVFTPTFCVLSYQLVHHCIDPSIFEPAELSLYSHSFCLK